MTSASMRRMPLRTMEPQHDENALPSGSSGSSCSNIALGAATSSPASITRMRSPSKFPTLSDIAARLNRDRDASCTPTGSPSKQQPLTADSDVGARPRLELTGRISGSPKPPAQQYERNGLILSSTSAAVSPCKNGDTVKVEEQPLMSVSPKATGSGACSPTKRLLAKGLPSLEEIRDRMSRKGLAVPSSEEASPKIASAPSSPSKVTVAEDKAKSPELKVNFEAKPVEAERKSPSPQAPVKKPSLKVSTTGTAKLNHPLPAPPLKSPCYPLQHEWTLFFDTRSSTAPPTPSFAPPTPSTPLPPTPTASSWEAKLRTIGSYAHVSTFLSCFSKLHRPSQLERHSSYHVFKDGIKPMWEDARNARGGKWTITFRARNPALVDRTWLWLVLGLIGEELDGEDECCGAVCSVRPRGDRIAVWVKDRDVAKANSIGRKLVKLLELEKEPGVSVEFSSHEDREVKIEGLVSWNNPMQMARTPTMPSFAADAAKLSPSAPVKPSAAAAATSSSPNRHRSVSPNPDAFSRLTGQAGAGNVFGRASPTIGLLGQSLGLGINASPNASPNPSDGGVGNKTEKSETAFSWRSANRSPSPQRGTRSRSTSPFKA